MKDSPKNNIPDVSDYVSDRVFDGVRTLTPEQTEAHRKRLKKSLDRRFKL